MIVQMAGKTTDYLLLLEVVSHHITMPKNTKRDRVGSGTISSRIARKAIKIFSDVASIKVARKDIIKLDSMAHKLA